MKNKGLHLVTVSTGSGTDADSVHRAFIRGGLSLISKITAISTLPDAGNIELVKKYKRFGINSVVINHKEPNFKARYIQTMQELDADLIFLLGCTVMVPLVPKKEFSGCVTPALHVCIPQKNIHPQHTREGYGNNPEGYGGQGKYGLVPHSTLLEDIMLELVTNPDKIFYAYPTVHDAHWDEYDKLVTGYDRGVILTQTKIPIPNDIVGACLLTGDLEFYAKKLQEYILPFEHAMLPGAVNAAALLM